MTIDYDLFRDKLNTLNHEIFKETNEQQVLPVLAIHQILKECEVKEMSDKIKSEVIDCKYYLPCGRCDKTNGFCSMLEVSNVILSTKPKEYPVNLSFYVPVNNDGVKPM